MRYWIAKIAYILTWYPWYFLFRAFFDYRIVYKDNAIRQLGGPLIIVANHSSWLDPLLVSGIFPPLARALPVRFATHYRFFHFPHTAPFAWLYGSFPVRRGVGLVRVLQPVLQFLNKGQAVGIFPEGRRRHLGRPRGGRRGAAYLAVKTGAPLLPVYIRGNLGITFKNFIFRRKKITVYAGRRFELPRELNNAESIEQLNSATKIIMQRLKEIAETA